MYNAFTDGKKYSILSSRKGHGQKKKMKLSLIFSTNTDQHGHSLQVIYKVESVNSAVRDGTITWIHSWNLGAGLKKKTISSSIINSNMETNGLKSPNFYQAGLITLSKIILTRLSRGSSLRNQSLKIWRQDLFLIGRIQTLLNCQY